MGKMTRIDLTIRSLKSDMLCIGAGFVALDIVEGERGRFADSGGSCGNVLSILSWLGWRTEAVSRLGDDKAGDRVVEELVQDGVGISHLIQDPRSTTPIVIHRFVYHPDGQREHRFALSCPDCGSWLPRFRPMTLKQVEPVITQDMQPNVFYFDRVSPSSLKLAKWASEIGALVMFEPSSITDERAFQRAVDTADILKYSHERLGHVPDLSTVSHPRLVIETFGEDGLHVRWRGRWSRLPAFEAPAFRDAAGSGDWCTAGLLHCIAETGNVTFASWRKQDVERGLRFGQALAALNCGFEGARGLMAAKTRKKVDIALRALQSRRQPAKTWAASIVKNKTPIDITLCGLCVPIDNSNRNVRFLRK